MNLEFKLEKYLMELKKMGNKSIKMKDLLRIKLRIEEKI